MVIVVSMVAVVSSTPVVPGISGATVIVRIRLRIRVVWPLVVPVRIIIIARWIGITIARKSKTDSANAGKAGGDLSVSALRGNESYSAYRQCNQEKFFHRIFLFCFVRVLFVVLRGKRLSAVALPSIEESDTGVRAVPSKESETEAVRNATRDQRLAAENRF